MKTSEARAVHLAPPAKAVMTPRATRRPNAPIDLAMMQTLNARIDAVRDVLRLTRALREAIASSNSTRIGLAGQSLERAKGVAAVAKSDLEAACMFEAKERL